VNYCDNKDGRYEFPNDCPDGSDEIKEKCCEAYNSVYTEDFCVGCREDQFVCGDGSCIHDYYFCDGSEENGNAPWPADCADGSDENQEECCEFDN